MILIDDHELHQIGQVLEAIQNADCSNITIATTSDIRLVNDEGEIVAQLVWDDYTWKVKV